MKSACPAWPPGVDQLLQTDRGQAFRLLRTTGPALRGPDGRLVVTRRADVLPVMREVLTSPKRLSTPDGRQFEFSARHFADYERVTTPRASREWVARWRPRAAALIAGVATTGRCDGQADVTRPALADLFLTMCDFPPGRLDGGPLDLAGLIQQRRAEPNDGCFISRLIAVAPDLPDGEVFALTQFLFQTLRAVAAAGAFGLSELARTPQLAAQLNADPDLMPAFTEEVYRFDGGNLAEWRVITEPTEIAGVTVEPGEVVVLLLGAANREAGDEYQIDSPPVHWAFGAGRRRCRGSHLARAALSALLTEWLAAVPDARLPDGWVPTIWFPQPVTFGLTDLRELPLRWDV